MSYQFILIPLIVAILTQVLKLSIDKIQGNLDLKNIWLSYGGMPSAHTAFAVSITTLVGIYEGINSTLFAVSLVFTILIMRDALSLRNIIGTQGKILNTLIEKLPSYEQKNFPRLQERFGHSMAEVVAGAIWSLAITWLLYYIVISPKLL